MTKRAFDIVISACALLIFVPLFLILAVAVRAYLGSPVLFRQRRPGCGARPFVMYKFRTMTDARNEDGRLLPDDQRLTRFGRLLRSSSLDELPELFNVLRGDMSLVGPRPLLMEYLPKYSPEQRRRHDMRPGITGWAQVNGRQHLPFSKRLELDVWYVRHWSFWLDIKILFRTVVDVFSAKGVISGQDVTEVDDVGLAAADLVRTPRVETPTATHQGERA